MRFYLTLLVTLLYLSTRLAAQCPVPNGNFEVLEDLTDTLSTELALHLKFPVTAPEGWIPLLRRVDIALSEFIVPFYDKDTLDLDVFGGMKSYVPGANGTDKALQLGGDEYSLVSDVIQAFPCQSRPDKLVGYFKYEGDHVRDSLSVLVLLKEMPDLNEENAIGIAKFNAFGGPEEYTKFEATFEYLSDEVPDSAIILIASERYEAWPDDSSFYVIDEITFEGGVVSTKHSIEEVLFVAPNPVSDRILLNKIPENNARLNIYNQMGMLVEQFANLNQREINVSTIIPGIYFAQLQTEQSTIIQKFIKL